MRRPQLPELCLIMDRTILRERPVVEAVRASLAGGLRCLQYREKDLGKRDSFEIARQLREITREAGALLIINDDIDLALALEADGVHIGQEDLPLPVVRQILGKEKIIGVSTHTVEEAVKAHKEGADYIGVGPLYPTQTKQTARSPVGSRMIREIRRHASLPLYGIGGVTLSNVREVIRAGATGVAVISAILTRQDISEATAEFLKVIREERDAG